MKLLFHELLHSAVSINAVFGKVGRVPDNITVSAKSEPGWNQTWDILRSLYHKPSHRQAQIQNTWVNEQEAACSIQTMSIELRTE